MKEQFREFLPISKEDMLNRGWYWYDFLLISGDAYVDHPSFGTVVIARVLEDAGYRVALLAQPDWRNPESFAALGKPRLGIMISGGNLDPMVAHYTAAKKRRSQDFYSPGGKAGLRPDRATIVYANRCREVFGAEMPIVVGGLEASLRRFAHYDYWDDKVRRALLFDAQADLLTYGMGERASLEIAKRLAAKVPVSQIIDVRGTCYATRDLSDVCFPSVEVASYEEVCSDKRSYARANMVEYEEHDPVRGRAIIQPHGRDYLVVNPPQMPLTTQELDHVAELPYMRTWHPVYAAQGGVPAIEEVRFSITHNRGCIGACNFCALAFHQGRMITARSQESVLREAKEIIQMPDFKGYIHDVGGPTANFRHPSCQKQLKCGMCKRNCLTPEPCPNVNADHSDYLTLLRRLRALPGVKKVFVRSGIRFDYMLLDKNDVFFRELVQYHISGQLKVAPEHCIDSVLDYMGKPHNRVYEQFLDKYHAMNDRYDKKQFLVPYLMSSHPGSTLDDAIALAEYLNSKHTHPEQVQDFYPTPGTLSTCMYYTGLDPRDMTPVYVARDPHEKAMQRALLQWKNPKNRSLIREALRKAGRTDLIGYGPQCLIRPDGPAPWEKKGKAPAKSPQGKAPRKNAPEGKPASRPKRKAGWAKPKPPKNGKKH
ncbi:MAG: YgiQ family radical SAM protein [Oscillospiraceae bacterium]|nr:YgiQ family radical SAM protein [Oscillospiraceae bacterium]